jgi:hypothetical protein
MTDIPINIAVEDILSEAVVKEIIKQSQMPFSIGTCLRQGGFGYLKRILPGINNAAQGSPYFILTDLDQNECPLALLTKWLSHPRHPNLIFRVAIREVESWLLADREAFSKFLGVSIDLIPHNMDLVPDPKKQLIELAKKSRNRSLRESIVPAKNSTAKVGKDYNNPLIQFVSEEWQVERAKKHSQSLNRAVNAVTNFKPIWQSQ